MFILVPKMGTVEREAKLLLSWDLDGEYPYLDPLDQIPVSHVTRTAIKLEIPEPEARARIEALAAANGLRLEWTPTS